METLSDKGWEASNTKIYFKTDVKEFIKKCEKNSKYSEGIKGNAMSIPIWKLKELAGEELI